MDAEPIISKVDAVVKQVKSNSESFRSKMRRRVIERTRFILFLAFRVRVSTNWMHSKGHRAEEVPSWH